jgi:DNA mismatch repair protein MutS
VVRRAQEILQELEAQGSNFALKERPANPHQISIFDDSHHPALEALRQLDVNQLSPLDALTKLYELQRLARGG